MREFDILLSFSEPCLGTGDVAIGESPILPADVEVTLDGIAVETYVFGLQSSRRRRAAEEATAECLALGFVPAADAITGEGRALAPGTLNAIVEFLKGLDGG